MRNQVELRPVKSRRRDRDMLRRTLDDAIIKLDSERCKLRQAIKNGAPPEAIDAYLELLRSITHEPEKILRDLLHRLYGNQDWR